jgi:hypothetical protein
MITSLYEILFGYVEVLAPRISVASKGLFVLYLIYNASDFYTAEFSLSSLMIIVLVSFILCILKSVIRRKHILDQDKHSNKLIKKQYLLSTLIANITVQIIGVILITIPHGVQPLGYYVLLALSQTLALTVAAYYIVVIKEEPLFDLECTSFIKISSVVYLQFFVDLLSMIYSDSYVVLLIILQIQEILFLVYETRLLYLEDEKLDNVKFNMSYFFLTVLFVLFKIINGYFEILSYADPISFMIVYSIDTWIFLAVTLILNYGPTSEPKCEPQHI